MTCDGIDLSWDCPWFQNINSINHNTFISINSCNRHIQYSYTVYVDSYRYFEYTMDSCLDTLLETNSSPLKIKELTDYIFSWDSYFVGGLCLLAPIWYNMTSYEILQWVLSSDTLKNSVGLLPSRERGCHIRPGDFWKIIDWFLCPGTSFEASTSVLWGSNMWSWPNMIPIQYTLKFPKMSFNIRKKHAKNPWSLVFFIQNLYPGRLRAWTWKWWFQRLFSFCRDVFSGEPAVNLPGCTVYTFSKKNP